MPSNMSPELKLSAARMRALKAQPYCSAGLLGLRPFKTEAVATLAVTAKGTMYWNPNWIAANDETRIAAGLLHELWHVLRGHHARTERMNITEDLSELANIAQDMEINDDLAAAKLDVGPDWIYPKSRELPDGLTWEEYFQRLRSQGGGSGGPEPGLGCGKCGSGAANRDGGELPADPYGDRSDAAMERVRRAVARAVTEHAKQHGIGSVPAGMQRFVDEVLGPPRVRWQEKLARLGRIALATRPGVFDFTYSRPSRRQAIYGWSSRSPLLPSMFRPDPEIWGAIDTSGSMDKGTLNDGAAEVDGIMRACGAPMLWLSCDCEIQSEKRAQGWREVAAALKGGGGTSFFPIFDRVKKARVRPQVLVIITDGGGYAPPQPPPGCVVIWVLVGAHQQRPEIPGGGEVRYGEFIEIPVGKRAA